LPRNSNFFIEVKGPFRKGGYVLSLGHYEYTLNVTNRNQDKCQVDRRYSDFDLLRRAIVCMFPGLFVTPLPPKDTLIAL
jgi:hypothetical protein